MTNGSKPTMRIVYAASAKHDQTVRHVSYGKLETLCGKYAGPEEPLALPVTCDECRAKNADIVAIRRGPAGIGDDDGKLYTATYSDGMGWNGSSVPLPLSKARAFILDALDRVKLGPTATAHDHDMRMRARDAFTETQRPMTFTVGVWTFTLEAADGGRPAVAERITMRSWLPGQTSRPSLAVISADYYSFDMKLNGKSGETVHSWTGTDRRGEPLTVQWLNPKRGTASLVAYEITKVSE
jgi:hypothetical protein